MKELFAKIGGAALAAALCLALLASCQSGTGPASSGSGSGADQSPPENPPVELSGTLYVLMYHHFVPEGVSCNTWTVTDTRFREDLQWLADHGYATVLPGELAAGNPLPNPDRTVMLTFDDGYTSNYELAYPLLQEFNAKAVIALITGHIEDEADVDFLSWDMCREMAQSGLVEFGSHTHTLHGSEYGGVKRSDKDTRETYDLRVYTDVQRSVDLIQDRLGIEPRFFAYPHGETDPWFNDYLHQHFDASVTVQPGTTDLSNGLYDMNRYTVSMEKPLSSILPE